MPPRDAYRSWMAETGSLTQRIRRACPADAPFAVHVLRQESATALQDEYPLLHLRPGRNTTVREVLLLSGARAVVFAHTVALRGAGGRLLNRVGGRSLGSVLFSDPRVHAGTLRFRSVDARHPLYRAARCHAMNTPARLWARRALFRKGHALLLVTEVFLPAILELHKP